MQLLSDILRQLFNNAVELDFDFEERGFEIEEPQNRGQNQLRSVLVKGISRFFFAFKLDRPNFPFLGTMMADGYARKSGDAVLFCQVKEQAYIFIFELKSNTAREIPEKFKSSRAIIDYLESVIEAYHELNFRKYELILVLFDRRVVRNQPNVVVQRGITFVHQGFRRRDNEIRVEAIIKALEEHNKQSTDRDA